MIDSISPISMPQRELTIQMPTASSAASTNATERVVFDRLLNVDNQIAHADGLITQYVAGQDIPVHELMMAIGKAKSELSVAVEIRNRMSAAYKEITSMQI